MRKIIILVIMVLCRLYIVAYDFESEGIYYNITSPSNLTVEVTYPQVYSVGWYSTEFRCAYKGDIVVPEKVINNGIEYQVTGVGYYAFGTSPTSGLEEYMHNLKSIQLPSTITNIGQCAFYMCDALKTIIIPSSVLSIGNDSFWCRNIEKIVFLSPNPPIVNPSGGHISGKDIHIPGEIWVPSKKSYSSWIRTIDGFWGGLVELCTPNESIFSYNGLEPTTDWTNNIQGYSMLVNDYMMQKNAGNYSVDVRVDYYRDNELVFSSIVPYEYTINKATLDVKANNASRVYGEDNPQLNISYSGFISGESESVLATQPTISTTATKTNNVGDYPITISGGSATNYELVYEPGVLTVTKAPLSAKVNDATKVYGTQNPAFTIDYYGLKNNESAPAWTTRPTFQTDATQSSGVGQYPIKAVNGVPINYDLGEITAGTLNITPAQLTIKANDAVRQYYSDDPNFTYTCSGFVNGDNASVLTATPSLSTSATRTSNVGTYEIKVGDTSSPNYSISFVNGTLTITPRTLIASVGNYERAYNEENPAFEVKYNGFVGNDDEKVLLSKPEAQTTATKTSDVGTYPINVTGGSADNYTFNYTSGTLTINKAEQTISWEQDLSDLKIGDQVELKASVTSGLPVKYTMDSNSFAEIYTIGNKSYLDCIANGEFQIVAIQEGNKNYYSSTRARKTATIGNASAIETIKGSEVQIYRTSSGVRVIDTNVGDIIKVYSIDGLLQKSVKTEDSTTDIPLANNNIYIIKVGGKTVKLSR